MSAILTLNPFCLTNILYRHEIQSVNRGCLAETLSTASPRPTKDLDPNGRILNNVEVLVPA